MPGGGDGIAGVKSLGSVAVAYPYHPEAKRSGPDGQPCGKGTAGVLSRRAVRAAGQVCIGKEAHRLEDRDLVASTDELQGVFADPRRAPWERTVLPQLETLSRKPGGIETVTATAGVSRQYLHGLMTGKRSGRSGVRTRLATVVRTMTTPEDRVCLGCGKSMGHKRPNARYCDDACRKQIAYDRKRAHSTSDAPP